VEDGSVVKTGIGVFQEIIDRDRSRFAVEVNDNFSFRGVDFNHRSGKGRSRGCTQQDGCDDFFCCVHIFFCPNQKF